MIWTLDELTKILGVPRRVILDADRRSQNKLLSWTRLHGGYVCHELLLPELKSVVAETPITNPVKRVRMPRILWRHKLS